MVDHVLHDAVHRVQEVGVLAHGQQRVDLGVQKVVAEEGIQDSEYEYELLFISSYPIM